MPLIVTKREAAQIATRQKKLLRRAFHKSRFMVGQKVPVVLEPGAKAPFVVEVIGVIEETVGSITDASARDEGFEDRADWLRHWTKQLYPGTNRGNDDTKVFTMRVRRTDLVQKRIRQTD